MQQLRVFQAKSGSGRGYTIREYVKSVSASNLQAGNARIPGMSQFKIDGYGTASPLGNGQFKNVQTGETVTEIR